MRRRLGFYRAILRAFVGGEGVVCAAFAASRSEIRCSGRGLLDESDSGALDAALAQLCEWRNLEAHRDTADVVTVEEFYRPRFLYQLTAEGEAAEHALAVFYETLEQPGELQTTALSDIRQYPGRTGDGGDRRRPG